MPSDCRLQVAAIREKLLEYIEKNAALEDDDLEKLSPEEFIVDLAQQQAWRDEGSAKVRPCELDCTDCTDC